MTSMTCHTSFILVVLAWRVLFYLFIFSLLERFSFRYVSCGHHIVEFCSHVLSDDLSLLIGKLNSFIFIVITDTIFELFSYCFILGFCWQSFSLILFSFSCLALMDSFASPSCFLCWFTSCRSYFILFVIALKFLTCVRNQHFFLGTLKVIQDY